VTGRSLAISMPVHEDVEHGTIRDQLGFSAGWILWRDSQPPRTSATVLIGVSRLIAPILLKPPH
jgi:hypothetical protein